MPESAIADVTSGFDLRADITATLNEPSSTPDPAPAAPAADAAPAISDTPPIHAMVARPSQGVAGLGH